MRIIYVTIYLLKFLFSPFLFSTYIWYLYTSFGDAGSIEHHWMFWIEEMKGRGGLHSCGHLHWLRQHHSIFHIHTLSKLYIYVYVQFPARTLRSIMFGCCMKYPSFSHSSKVGIMFAWHCDLRSSNWGN